MNYVYLFYTYKTFKMIDYSITTKAALALRAVNHKLRQQIIKLLLDSKSLTVTEIYVKLRLEQSVVSQHLAILRKAKVVKTYRDGKYITYTVNIQKLKDFESLSAQILS